MNKYFFITMVLCICMSFTCSAQTRKAGTAQRKSTTTQKRNATPSQKSSSASTAVIDDSEISLKGRIDYIKMGNNSEILPTEKNDKTKIKADFMFKVYNDPTDSSRPRRKTAILICDIDFRTWLEKDEDVPCDWSWSSRNIKVIKKKMSGTTYYGDKIPETMGYMVYDGKLLVCWVIPNTKVKGKVVNVVGFQPGGSQLTDLRPGIHIDDLARKVQKEIPGTRVVLSGNTKDGLTEYLLLGYGENKVYDVTGDYHYELNNNEPYFTFWTDSNDKLVKWFTLKKR